ncbi:MAG: putative Phage tail tape measure protein family, core region [Bradyrhizobium sp.]|nr:putative Phage tail tape measure protein family, core region [Bradyrhizobium sp.]
MREIEARLKLSATDKTGKAFTTVGNRMKDVSRRADAFNRHQMLTMNRMAMNDSSSAAYFAKRDANILLREKEMQRRTTAMAEERRMQQAMYAANAAHYAKLGGVIAGAAVGYELVRATDKAADFETALFNIQKKSGATAEQIQKLALDIRALSNEMPISRDDIAAGMERGAAAGVPIGELKEFTRLTAMIADGWEVSAEESGNFIAGFNKGLHIPMDKMQAFASLINDLADSGIADEKDIADFIDRAGASLMNFGMTPEQIAAYGAAFLNLKMPADVAARAMDTLTGKLLAPENLGKKSRTALTAIVGDLGKFSKLSGSEKMTRFMKSLQGMTSQRKASLLGALLGEGFDDEIMRVVSALDEVDRNLEAARRHMEKPSNSIFTTYQKQLETFNKRVAVLKNQLADIELSLGNRLLPLAEKVVTAVSKGLKAQDHFDAGKESIGHGDDDLFNMEKKEFLDAFKTLGFDNQKKGSHARPGLMEFWRGVRAVGSGDVKSLDDYLQILRDKYDPKGDRSKQLALYRPGKGPVNLLNAEPSTGKVPVPSSAVDALKEIVRDHYRDAGRMHAGKPEIDSASRTLQEIKDLAERYKASDVLQGLPKDAIDMQRREEEQARLIANARALKGDEQRAPVSGRFINADRDREIAEGRAEKIRRMRGDESRRPEFAVERPKPKSILGSIFDGADGSDSRKTDSAAQNVASSLEQGGQKIADGGDEAAKSIVSAAQEFSRIVNSAGAQLSAILSSIKIPSAPGGVAPSKVNANTGRTNDFVRSPTGGSA